MVKSPDPTDKHVGARVRLRRMMLGMSQTTLGEALGLTFQQVQKYEKGTNRISASRLQQISCILQIPVPFLFEGLEIAPRDFANIEPMPTYVSDFLITSDGQLLMKAFMRIGNQKLRRSIVDLIKQIASRD